MKRRFSWSSPRYARKFSVSEHRSLHIQVDPSKGYKGITCFIVEKDMGVKIAKKEQKLGIRASSTCTLAFDDVRVPLENVIGGEGTGYKVL
jgi:alkylation response protein AidB-like acyl-CoA dehydrogenase